MISGLSPLEFRITWLAIVIFIITIATSFPTSKIISQKLQFIWLRKIILMIPKVVTVLLVVYLVITFPFSFIGLWNYGLGGYQTTSIEFRKKETPKIHIANQSYDIGGRGYLRRKVKIIPITPLFAWVTLINEPIDDTEWNKVYESYNPFNLKFP